MNQSTPKTVDDLYRMILSFLPQASVGEDLDGQIVIYTNLREDQTFQLESLDR